MLVITIVSFFIITTGQVAASSYVLVEENNNYEYNQVSECSDLIIMNMPKPSLSPNNNLVLNKLMPNDLFFPDQWALHNTGQTGGLEDADIDAVEAWDIETGNSDVVISVKVSANLKFNGSSTYFSLCKILIDSPVTIQNAN